MAYFFSAFHPRRQGTTAPPPRLHLPPEEQPGSRAQAVVLLVAAHLALPRRRQHRGPRGPRAHRALALCAQPRAAQRAPLRRRALCGAHAAPERAPRARAARPAPPAAAAAARPGAVRGHRARHGHGQRHRRGVRQHRRRGPAVTELAAAARAARARRQAATGGHSL